MRTPRPVSALRSLPPAVIYLLKVYALLGIVAMAFRILLLLLNDAGAHDPSDTLHALFIGWRFDTTIACYLLALPFLLLLFDHFRSGRATWPVRIVSLCLAVLSIPVLLILAADVPWSLHYLTRLNTSALLWSDEPRYMIGLVTQDPMFRGFLLLFVAMLLLVAFLLRRWRRTYSRARNTSAPPHARRWSGTLLLLLTGALLALGMRGRVARKQPIHAGLAYFSDDAFLNQLGLNPVFTITHSLLDHLADPAHRVTLMDPERALALCRDLVHAPTPPMNASPIARYVPAGDTTDRMNVVIILMESMGTFKMGDYNGPQGLTVVLNELRGRSLDLRQCYSAGIHTYNGIYSTLFSFPALFDQRPMEIWRDKPHRGLARELGDHGYRSIFFTTHDPQFDNMAGFLRSHGFGQIVAQDDYPSEWVVSTNGVPDHRMFEFALPRLDDLAREGPFLAVLLTTSDHKPYLVPDDLWYTPRADLPITERIVEYCDRAIGHFLDGAARYDWYRRTL
ncbi:MAG: LTA synthase family protein, partial [Flavobacteriales bacterium]|nr:LTA synthase family protein [Flavobacteriales bacterium]